MLRTLAFAAAALLWPLALAPTAGAEEESWYLGAAIGQTRMPVVGRDYEAFALKLRAGGTHPTGFGLELQALTGLGDDTKGGIEIGVDSTLAAFARYEYPRVGSFRIYALAGFARTSLSISGAGTQGLEENLDGFAYGIGLQESLRRWPRWIASVEFNNYYSDSNVDIWSLSAGLRYAF